jgi:hypothetical protein
LPTRYRERTSRLTGAVVWTRTAVPGDSAPVLPDGCMDLLWTEGRLFVAGPDTRAYVSDASAGTRFAGVRFFPGRRPPISESRRTNCATGGSTSRSCGARGPSGG